MVSLMDDLIHEEDEEFRLVLGSPKSKSRYGASIGEQKEALVTITDEKDSMCSLKSNIISVHRSEILILQSVPHFRAHHQIFRDQVQRA